METIRVKYDVEDNKCNSFLTHHDPAIWTTRLFPLQVLFFPVIRDSHLPLSQEHITPCGSILSTLKQVVISRLLLSIHFKALLPQQREWDSWAHKPALTHLYLVHSLWLSVVLCVYYQ